MKNKNPNPKHNIWNNNGTWWCHYTVHKDDYTKERVRVSLGTNDVQIARALCVLTPRDLMRLRV